MSSAEQLRLVSPEYRNAVDELYSAAGALMITFANDVENSGGMYPTARLFVALPGEFANGRGQYYTLRKQAPEPVADDLDWDALPVMIGQDYSYGDGGGTYADYDNQSGVLTAKHYPYENDEIDDYDGEEIELGLDHVVAITNRLIQSRPVHPFEAEPSPQTPRNRMGQFLARVLRLKTSD